MAALFWYFIIYSFFGFILEVLFAWVTRNPKRDRKCFYFLPLCPVYGLGALFILAISPLLDRFPILLMVGAGAAATGAEYLLGWVYEDILGVQFWDYSHLPLNVNGKVCLLFSAAWGILGAALIYWVHPTVMLWVSAIPGLWLLPAALFLTYDALLTVNVLARTGSTDSLMWYKTIGRA